MAISSPLNPSTIARERSTTAQAAQNFITGGSPLGEGVVASAANKIVGFQRGAAGVAARPPDLNSIIQTLSSNILNNVENRVQSINQNVTQIVNKTIGGLQTDYKERLDKIDAARPNSILQNFLNLYKSALEYIQFLGNRKNVKTLGDNLKSLQNIFAETFNVAKIIRQTIVNIVKQLSNLPAATAGGGGLNLDIDIPGGSLRKGPMSGITRMMRRRPGMMLGGAALAGGLGSQVVSGMLDVGGDVQAAPMAEGAIPTSLLDRFNGILDRFSAAINRLSSRKPTSAPAPGGASPAPQTDNKEKPGGGGGGGGGGAASTDSLKGNNNAEKIYNQLIAEGFTPQAAAGVIGNIMQESGADPTKKQYGGGPGRGLLQWGTGKGSGERYDRLTKWAKENGKDPLALETQYQYMMMEMKERGTYRRLKGVKDVNQATLLFEKEMTQAGTPMMENRYKFAQSAIKQYGSGTLQPGKPGIAGKPGEKGASGKPGVDATAQPAKPTVTPAPAPAATSQQIAQTVSQPPVQQKPQITVAPMNMASPQTQSTKVGDKAIPPPVMSKGGVSVPFLSSSNNDNFLTLYSKMVYNIVDG